MSRPTRITRLTQGALLALALALSTTSCAILVPPEPRSGGDGLSDAAREAKKKPEDQTTLVAGEATCSDCDTPDPIGAGLTVSSRFIVMHPRPLDEPRRPARNPLEGWHGGLIAGGGTVVSSEYENSALFGVRLGGEPAPQVSADIALLGAP